MAKTYKIAIMTWYTYKNYGTALQASALSHIVQKMGYQVDFINYLPKGGAVSKPKLDLAKQALNRLKKFYSSAELDNLYENYLAERISCTTVCTSYAELHDLNKEYDAFICGSDQIWSPLCYDSKYFLDFVESPNKMIAYAPSIGSIEINDPIIRDRLVSHISRFQHLSIREQQGADLIKTLTGQAAKVVLDPTLLMEAAKWDMFARVEKVRRIDGKYILCYFLGDAGKYMRYVQLLSRKMHIPFYVIPITLRQKKDSNAVPFEVGPSEFVSLIRNATYVCTDSYHGMAFSINYNIPFSVFKRFKDDDPKNQNSRIFNLLKLLNLENRLTDYTGKCPLIEKSDCDFSIANSRLSSLRKDSLAYLENALKSVTSVEHPKAMIVPYKITDMCCGCGACATVCAKGAISIYRNNEGFEHYQIDATRCVQCGQCKTVCPMTNIVAPSMKESKALYSVKSRSEQVLRVSSSGGVGYELSSKLLAKGYAVCGCTYDIANNSAQHIWIMPGEEEKLYLLQGSKYIQSVSSDAMKQLIEISKVRKVAFFGTPCQVAAVDKVLSKMNLRDNAVLVDLICHGVPSYLLWDKYLKDIDKKHRTGAHPMVLFRSKESGWRRLMLKVYSEKRVYKKEEHTDDFYAFFRRGLCYMESCSDCPYRERSAADLRIGDFWGDRFAHDKQGVSMVIANTLCGDGLIKTLNTCETTRQNLREYWSVQFPYNPPRPLVREQLIMDLKDDNTDLHMLRKRYCTYYDRKERIYTVAYRIKKIMKR